MNLVVDRSCELSTGYDDRSHLGRVHPFNRNRKGDGKTATVKLGVPSEAFEDVLRQIRGTALQVKWERATGSDVTSEYVDLQSQLTNLQATQARLREFLNRQNRGRGAQGERRVSKIEGEKES